MKRQHTGTHFVKSAASHFRRETKGVHVGMFNARQDQHRGVVVTFSPCTTSFSRRVLGGTVADHTVALKVFPTGHSLQLKGSTLKWRVG